MTDPVGEGRESGPVRPPPTRPGIVTLGAHTGSSPRREPFLSGPGSGRRTGTLRRSESPEPKQGAVSPEGPDPVEGWANPPTSKGSGDGCGHRERVG